MNLLIILVLFIFFTLRRATRKTTEFRLAEGGYSRKSSSVCGYCVVSSVVKLDFPAFAVLLLNIKKKMIL